MFLVIDDRKKLARVTLNNPFTGKQEVVDTLNNRDSIAYAVRGFAFRHGIPAKAVQTSILYPEETVTA